MADGGDGRRSFSAAELGYLQGERKLGRFATIQPDGSPHVVPVGWRYDSERGVVEVSGREFASTKKFRNAKTNPKVALVIDDVLPPWRPRCVMVQGEAEVVEGDDRGRQAAIRIHPTNIISWGLERGGVS